MRMYDVIKKKRDGGRLSREEIRDFIDGYVAGRIPDYQAAALCMAIYFRGMDAEETTELTLAIRDSGETLHFDGIDGLRLDKHSTCGVGDKTSLIVAPLVASLGVKVAKMSGRGLGHTGGTVDKLEAIRGFRTDLSVEEFQEIVNRTGLAIVGQSRDLAPADKLLYALRDVTATVDSIPLIASSIMGKKLAADDDGIVLDVKTGSGAFMKSQEEALELARTMVEIGRRAGKRMCALITDMDQPLGCAIGNSLEVIEAIETLRGCGPDDLTQLSVALAARMLVLAGKGNYEDCEAAVRENLANGEGLRVLAEMVRAQGGDERWIYDPSLFPQARWLERVRAPHSGVITAVDAEGYGTASLILGAGRSTKDEAIDPAAGIRLLKRVGDTVESGETVAILYTDTRPWALSAAARKLLASTLIGGEKPPERTLILAVVE